VADDEMEGKKYKNNDNVKESIENMLVDLIG